MSLYAPTEVTKLKKYCHFFLLRLCVRESEKWGRGGGGGKGRNVHHVQQKIQIEVISNDFVRPNYVHVTLSLNSEVYDK